MKHGGLPLLVIKYIKGNKAKSIHKRKETSNKINITTRFLATKGSRISLLDR
jgi:hypothetical protein